jgi:hypothetical protein
MTTDPLHTTLNQFGRTLESTRPRWAKALRLWREIRMCLAHRGDDLDECYGHHLWDGAFTRVFGGDWARLSAPIYRARDLIEVEARAVQARQAASSRTATIA